MTPSLLERTELRALRGVQRHAAAGALPPAAWWLGLGSDECGELLARVGVEAPLAGSPPPAAPPPLLAPLVTLLWMHRDHDDAWSRLMAGAIASACFGRRHLWCDLGLDGRPAVSALMATHFPALAAENAPRHLRWKFFLFVRLGRYLGQPGLRPPHCRDCDDLADCSATSTLTLLRRIDARPPLQD